MFQGHSLKRPYTAHGRTAHPSLPDLVKYIYITDYLTWLDTYVQACFALLVLLTVQGVVANALAAGESADGSTAHTGVDEFSKYSAIGLAAAWAAFNAWFAVRVRWSQSNAPGLCERRLMRHEALKVEHRVLYGCRSRSSRKGAVAPTKGHPAAELEKV